MKAGNLVSLSRGTAAECGTGADRLGCVRQSAADRDGGPIVVVIDRCEPARSYLVRCLQEVTDGVNIVAFATVRQWFQVAQGYKRPKAILICNSNHDDPGGEITEDLSPRENFADVPVFLVPNTDMTAPATERSYRRSRSPDGAGGLRQ